jgi:hypothetical protein
VGQQIAVSFDRFSVASCVECVVPISRNAASVAWRQAADILGVTPMSCKMHVVLAIEISKNMST